MAGKKLEEIMGEKDFGVLLSRTFKVSKQCMKAAIEKRKEKRKEIVLRL